MAATRKKKASEPSFVLPPTVPVLISVDLVAFPHVMMSLYIDQPQSVKAVEAAVAADGHLFVVAHSSENLDGITLKDIKKVGVLCAVVRMLKLADGRYKVLVQGRQRASATKLKERGEFLSAKVELLDSVPFKDSASSKELLKRIQDNVQLLVEHEYLPEEMLLVMEEIEDPGHLSDIIVAHYKLELDDAQSILEELDPVKRLKATDELIQDDLQSYVISEGIKDKTREEMAKGQRDYFLREQLRQIQRELGEGDDVSGDLPQLRSALERRNLPEKAHVEAFRQLSRLERMHSESSEYAMLRTYLEWIADLPWGVKTKDRFELAKAKAILEEEHFGLEKAKDRILEFLSVRKLKRDSAGPILCLVGPPGVGKTSLGRSIAHCLNRQFFRMSLGGVRDEAEIRGHRRTYVGALPGRIIQGLKEAGSCNPVIMLDELDKVGADFRGDPAAALLEILDPNQNAQFHDHYLNIDFDLSNCLFIATANTTDTIPEALLDRLEVLTIPGYTALEKRKIAERYLVPRQVADNGLTKLGVTVPTESLDYLVEHYTREAGVRNLDRQVAALCRRIARLYVETKVVHSTVTPEAIREWLGPARFDPEENEHEAMVGLARGLAWTVHGGEVLPVEVSIAAGKGRLTLTGQLGDVMQESAQAAVFYARANAASLGIPTDFIETHDVHIHLPGGATPKDGPSAGITIVTALVSALSGRAVSHEVAMTGEITLRGSVLAIGGLKEKALAALRYGITRVIIPQANVKDLEDIAEEQRAAITFIPVKNVKEVLNEALLPAMKETESKATGVSRTLSSTLLLER
jgi:ATP-dependent Lon protease